MKKIFILLTTIFISLNVIPVKAMEKASDILKENIVTEGEGLYEDSTIEGRYIYKGGNPNNYIKLGNDLYRIVSVESDGTIKVVRNESIGNMAWDESGARYSTNSDDFCTSDRGCKSWGSNTTTLNTSGNNVTQMPWEVGGTLKNLPDKEATLNIFLNNDWYNSLDTDVQDLIVEKYWNVGPTAHSQTDLSESINEESAYKWKGKIALINATDYVKASTNSACTSVSANNGNTTCYNNSDAHNYLYKASWQWTVSPNATSYANYVLDVYLSGYIVQHFAYYANHVQPAFYLSSNISLEGEGTETNPYTINNNEDVKSDQSKEDNSTSVDVVEVPSTSAFGSIAISVLGIVCVFGSIFATKLTLKKRK